MFISGPGHILDIRNRSLRIYECLIYQTDITIIKQFMPLALTVIKRALKQSQKESVNTH